MDLSVYEIFTSFQGEGIHTGLPTTFIRLAGCNLDCRWCDTKYALRIEDGKMMSIHDIIGSVERSGLDLICLTGGEPLVQENGLELVRELMERSKRIDLETNGSLDIRPYAGMGPDIMISMDVKTPSSGQEDRFLLSNLDGLRKHDQLKFIVADQKDLDFALDFIGKYRPL